MSAVFLDSNQEQHCSGVEALALSDDSQYLFSGSRDSTIRRWELGHKTPLCQGTYEGHVDWVNDLVLVQDSLVSCSNDKTVKVWQTEPEGKCVHTFMSHTDYVTCLAASQVKGQAVSAGLGAELCLLDLHSGKSTVLFPPASTQSSNAPAAGSTSSSSDSSLTSSKGSIYALSMKEDGSLIAAGGTDAVVRLFDPRSGRKVMKLKGHTDIIRSLLVNREGTHLLSSSSDHTVRLWDLGQQRCVHVVAVHTDSVLCLAASEAFDTVYSGGRDRQVYRTVLPQRCSELMLVEQSPIRKMVYDKLDHSMWVSGLSSTINKWQIPPESFTPRGSCPGDLRTMSGRSLVVGSSPLIRLRQSMEARKASEPATKVPCSTIPGRPGIVQYKVLNNRRNILTRNSQGEVELWDVMQGAVVERYGQVDFAAKEAELFAPVSVPSWFTADNKLGTLSLHLEPPGCFGAEIYALDLGEDRPEDFKYNLGLLALKSWFGLWSQCRAAATHLGSEDGAGPLIVRTHSQTLAPHERQQLPNGQAVYPPPPPQTSTLPWHIPAYLWPHPPSIMSEHADGLPWRMRADHFTGKEQEFDDIPGWVVHCVVKDEYLVPKETKCAFVLLPAENSKLPSLLQSKLNAPRILQVSKVANYCQQKLIDQNIQVEVVAVDWDSPPGAPVPPPDNLRPGTPMPPVAVLELVCNNLAVPYSMSLAAVKKYIWKRSDDIVFYYRLRDLKNLPPMPVITPPSEG